MEEYKNNSLKAQTEPKTEKPKMTPIVKGEVKKKDSLKSKILSTFIHEDKESVLEYAIMDIVVPKLKEAAIDVVNGTLSMLFYGDSGKGRVNYNKSSSASYRQGQRTNYQQESTRSGTEGVILENRSDAIAVLNQLRDLVTDYDRATVADYYDLVGISSNFTDNNFGWTNLDSAYVSAVRGGYTVILPKARAL